MATKTITSFSTHREYQIKLYNLHCHSSNVVYHAQTIEVVLKVFNLDLTITNQPTGVLLKGILSNKHYFTLTLMTNMVWVIGNYPHWSNRECGQS